jgi:hypothetical protein
MDSTFGGVHFVVITGGFLRLPGTKAPDFGRTSTPTIVVPSPEVGDLPYLIVTVAQEFRGISVTLEAGRSVGREEGTFVTRRSTKPQIVLVSKLKYAAVCS